MYKIFFIFLLSIFSVVSLTAAIKLTPEQKKISEQIGFTLESKDIEDLLRKSVDQIKNGKADGKPLRPIEYDIISSKIEKWIKYRWFIADTGLSRAWLKKINELIKYMAKTKRYLNAAKFSGNIKNAKYPQAVKYFDVAYERLMKLVKKPAKVSMKSFRRAKLKKVLWQKAMRKKYKIKENISTAEF